MLCLSIGFIAVGFGESGTCEDDEMRYLRFFKCVNFRVVDKGEYCTVGEL